jgi:tape measure domain-containing protein
VSDGIDVPIKLPTDSTSVRTAAAVVAQLEGAMLGLGPAAAAGSAQAASAMARTAGAIAKVQAQASAARSSLATIAAKRDAGIEVANAKGFNAAQVAAQKAMGDLGKIRAKQEGALELVQAKAAASAADQARAQAHAREMARIKARGAAEKAQAHAQKGGAAGSPAANDNGGGGGDAMAAIEGLAPAAGAIAAVVAAITAVVSKVASVTAAFYAALVAVQAFRESTVSAFAKLLGGAKAADAAFQGTLAMASKIGVGVKEALSGVNSLIAKGFKANEAQDLVKAMADLKSVVPDANISNLLLAISQIKSKGVLQMEELQGQIAEAGLSVSVVLEEIGKKIGKSSADVRKMIAAGKIDASQGIAGIMAAIQKTTGKPLGKAAEEAANSLQGLLARAQDLPTALLMAADSSKGMSTVKGALQSLLAAFGPGSKSGDALAASLGRMGDALSTLLGGLTGKSGANALETLASGIARTIDKIAAYTAKVGAALGPRIGKAIEMFGKSLENGTFDRVLSIATVAMDTFLMTIEIVDGVRDAFDSAMGALGRFGAMLGLIEPQTKSLNASMSGAGGGIGANLIQGIIAGMQGGIPGLMAAVGVVASMTTGAAKTGFGTHSPSVIWRDEIGYQLPAGGAQGIESGGKLMRRSASKLAANTNAAAVSAIGGDASKQAPSIGELHFHGMTRSDADFFEARTRTLLAELAVA